MVICCKVLLAKGRQDAVVDCGPFCQDAWANFIADAGVLLLAIAGFFIKEGIQRRRAQRRQRRIEASLLRDVEENARMASRSLGQFDGGKFPDRAPLAVGTWIANRAQFMDLTEDGDVRLAFTLHFEAAERANRLLESPPFFGEQIRAELEDAQKYAATIFMLGADGVRFNKETAEARQRAREVATSASRNRNPL